MIYQWKRHYPANAQLTGEYLERIAERDGGILPSVVVNEARNKDALLHNCFEWNNSTAAEKYREGQARSLIKNIITIDIVRGEEKTAPSFVSVQFKNEQDNNEDRRYVTVRTAMNDDYMREYILRDALRELNSFRKKYKDLQELSSLFTEMEKLLTA